MLSLQNSLFFLLLVCLLTKVSHCVEFTFELPDNSEDCFYEEIKRNTSAYLEFQVSICWCPCGGALNAYQWMLQVSAGGQLDVDVQLKDPQNRVIYEQQRATFDSHQFTAEVSHERGHVMTAVLIKWPSFSDDGCLHSLFQQQILVVLAQVCLRGLPSRGWTSLARHWWACYCSHPDGNFFTGHTQVSEWNSGCSNTPQAARSPR